MNDITIMLLPRMLLLFVITIILILSYVICDDYNYIDSVPIPPYSTTGMIIDGGTLFNQVITIIIITYISL